MSEILDKRVSIPPVRFSPGNALGKRENLKAFGANTRTNGASDGGRPEKPTTMGNGQLIESSSETQDGIESETPDIESDSEYGYEQDMQELEGEVRNISDKTDEILHNNFVVLSALFSVLPSNKLDFITKNLGEDHAEDQIWLRILLENEDRRRTEANENNNSEISVSDNDARAPAAAATTTGAAAAAAAASVVDTGVSSYAAAATTVRDSRDTNTNVQDRQNKIQQEKKYIDDQVRAKIEDLARKRNFIISGMSEEHEVGGLVKNMLWALGLEYLIDSVQSEPTRLGTKHHNGKVRTIRVEMRNEWEVEQVMKYKYALRDMNDYWQVYINNDLSKEDREK